MTSELSYRRFFMSARDGILTLDVDTGRVSDANPFLVELPGYSRAGMIGRRVGESSPAREIVSSQAMLERLQKRGFVRYDGLPLETEDGRHITVEFVSNAYQADGKVHHDARKAAPSASDGWLTVAEFPLRRPQSRILQRMHG